MEQFCNPGVVFSYVTVIAWNTSHPCVFWRDIATFFIHFLRIGPKISPFLSGFNPLFVRCTRFLWQKVFNVPLHCWHRRARSPSSPKPPTRTAGERFIWTNDSGNHDSLENRLSTTHLKNKYRSKTFLRCFAPGKSPRIFWNWAGGQERGGGQDPPGFSQLLWTGLYLSTHYITQPEHPKYARRNLKCARVCGTLRKHRL